MEKLQQLHERALTYPEQANSIIIHNPETLKIANDFLLAVKKMLKEIGDAFGPIIEKAHKAHKEALAQRKKYEEPLLKAERAVKQQIGVYVRKQEEIRREAERKAKEAEADRLRKQAEIEAEAQRFENEGYFEEAEEIRAQESETTDAAIVPDAPSLNGISVRRILDFEIIDEEKIPRRFLSVDSKKIREYLREHKEKALDLDIPGIKVFYRDSVASRAGE